MRIRWQKMFAKTMIWLATELMLNFTGIGTLATYGEFILERSSIISAATIATITTISSLDTKLFPSRQGASTD